MVVEQVSLQSHETLNVLVKAEQLNSFFSFYM